MALNKKNQGTISDLRSLMGSTYSGPVVLHFGHGTVQRIDVGVNGVEPGELSDRLGEFIEQPSAAGPRTS